MAKNRGSCTYLAGLLEDYRSKIQDPKWSWLHAFLTEEMYKVEYRLHAIRETDLCANYQQAKISRSILQSTNFAF